MLYDPAVQKMMFGLGESKGLEGIGLAPIGPSSIVMRKEVKSLADLKGIEDPRAGLAVPARADPPDGRLAGGDDARRRAAGHPAGHDRRRARRSSPSTRTFQYQDAAKYVIENDQPYISSIVVMSKRWLATLPPDLQKIVRDNAAKVSKEIVPFVKDFFAQADATSGRARAAC